MLKHFCAPLPPPVGTKEDYEKKRLQASVKQKRSTGARPSSLLGFLFDLFGNGIMLTDPEQLASLLSLFREIPGRKTTPAVKV